MSISYDFNWVRYLSEVETEVGEVNDPFAVYASDYNFGVRVNFQGLFSESNYEYTWRIRTYGAGGFLISGFDFRLVRDDGPVTGYSRRYSPDGEPLDWLEKTFDGVLIWVDLASAFFPRDEYEYLSSLDTVTVYYEVLNGSTVIDGGLDIPAGLLGTGFDLRDLYIPELNIDSFINANDPDNYTANMTGDVYALPASTSLFPSGWQPVGDLTFRAYSSGSTAADYQPLPLSPGPDGLIASFDVNWDGYSQESDDFLQGLHQMEVSARGENPGNDPGSTPTDSTALATGEFRCSVCPVDGVTICQNSDGMQFSYSSENSLREAQSLGYGWSSEASIRIQEVGDQVFLQTASGMSLRWTWDGSEYTPVRGDNYAELQQDATHWLVTFKDQTIYHLNISDGKLDYTTDRSNKLTTYGYDTNGHLDYIADQNGRSISFSNRDDGQPEVMFGHGGRATSFYYYDETDPVSPNRLLSIVDPEGNTTDFSYDSNGRLMSVTDPQGYTVFYTYDEYGRVASEQRGDQTVKTYAYTDFSEDYEDGVVKVEIQEASFVDPEYRQVEVLRDLLGRVLQVTELLDDPTLYDPQADPLDRVYRNTVYHYNDPSQTLNLNPQLLTRIEDHNGNNIEMTYTNNGNLKTITDKGGYITTYEYAEEIDLPTPSKQRNLVRKIYRPSVTVDGVVETYSPTEFQYDFYGNLERIIDAKGQETVMVLDTDGLVLSATDRNGNTTEFLYEGLPQNGESRNLLQVKVPKGETAADGFRTITLDYDDFDNVISVKDDLGNEVVTNYDDIDRPLTVTDARNSVASFVYQDLLLVETLLPANSGSNGNSRKTSLNYDGSNRLMEVKRDIDALGTQDLRVRYAYNGYSQVDTLTRIKDGVEKHFTFRFDQAGRPIGSTDSLANMSSTAYEPFCVGNATTSARGVRRRSNFDARCLLQQIESGDPDPLDPLAVLNPRKVRNWDYDELGRMVKSGSPSSRYGETRYGQSPWAGEGERLYLYDELDRLVALTFEDGSQMFWGYDAEGNVTSVTDPEGKVTRYEYYRDNLLHKVIVERPSQADRVFEYSYDPAGRLDKIVYPASTGIEGVFRDEADLTPTGIGTGFDANGNLRFLRYQKTGGTLIRRYEWTYDDSNNRQSQLEVTPTKAVLWEYSVDWLDRLVAVKRAEAADVASLPASPLGALHLQREYVWDESDNRTFFDDHVAGVTYHYTYKSIDDNGTTRYSDQLDEILIYPTAAGHRTVGDFVSFETFLHDADGNMTKRTVAATGEEISMEWTDFDRLKRVESDQNGRMQDARYDVDGLRERKLDRQGNSSQEYGVGINTSASTPGSKFSGAPTISYIQGAGGILGAEIDDGTGPKFIFHLTDALSTTRDVIDDQGNLIRSFEFSEYGDLISSWSSGTGTVSPKTWIGGLSVNDDTADSGMFNMGHRNFAAGVLGRFISRDPIGHRGNLNLYAYPTNPVTFVDPHGLEVTAVFDTKTGKMTVTTTEGDSFVYENVFSGDGPCKNDLTKGHVPFKGPVPRGTYYLGDPVDTSSAHPEVRGDLDWIPILNQETMNDRVFLKDPTGKTVERNAMYVHPGSVSQGCVTFLNRDNEQGEIGNPDFTQLKDLMSKTTRITKWLPGTGRLGAGRMVSYPGVLVVK
jgi:RHS repeat-associated protein